MRLKGAGQGCVRFLVDASMINVPIPSVLAMAYLLKAIHIKAVRLAER